MSAVLSNKDILAALEDGSVVISDFNESQLANCSYDVTLGEHYYRFYDHKVRSMYRENSFSSEPENLYNMYDDQTVLSAWQVQSAGRLSDSGLKLKNIGQKEKVIFISPGETILAHTNEFIGGRKNITTMMKARSSIGRNFIEVCKCAGWGDVGYVNRWTMEITNNSKCIIPLVVGRRIAQIIFMNTGELKEDQDYLKQVDMKYGSTFSAIEEIKANWKPADMLPKMWKDREVKALKDGADGLSDKKQREEQTTRERTRHQARFSGATLAVASSDNSWNGNPVRLSYHPETLDNNTG